jgi:hypothetical protein
VQPFAHNAGALFINESRNYFPVSPNLLHCFPHPVDSFRNQTTTMSSTSADQEMAAAPGNQDPSSEEVVIISGTVQHFSLVPIVLRLLVGQGGQQARKSSAIGFYIPQNRGLVPTAVLSKTEKPKEIRKARKSPVPAVAMPSASRDLKGIRAAQGIPKG